MGGVFAILALKYVLCMTSYPSELILHHHSMPVAMIYTNNSTPSGNGGSAPTATSPPTSSPRHHTPTGAIVGGVIGGLIAAGLALMLLFAAAAITILVIAIEVRCNRPATWSSSPPNPTSHPSRSQTMPRFDRASRNAAWPRILADEPTRRQLRWTGRGGGNAVRQGYSPYEAHEHCCCSSA